MDTQVGENSPDQERFPRRVQAPGESVRFHQFVCPRGTAPKNPRLLATEFVLDKGRCDGGGRGFL